MKSRETNRSKRQGWNEKDDVDCRSENVVAQKHKRCRTELLVAAGAATCDWAESSQVKVTLRSLSAFGEEGGQVRSRKVCREKLREGRCSINRTFES